MQRHRLSKRSTVGREKCSFCSKTFVYAKRLHTHLELEHPGMLAVIMQQMRNQVHAALDAAVPTLIPVAGTPNAAPQRPPPPPSPANVVIPAPIDSDEEYALPSTDDEDDDQDGDGDDEQLPDVLQSPLDTPQLDRIERMEDFDPGAIVDYVPTVAAAEKRRRKGYKEWLGNFDAPEDYELARWMVRHRISNEAADQFFALSKKYPGRLYQGPITSAFTLFSRIDKMTDDRSFIQWKDQKVLIKAASPADSGVDDSEKDSDDEHAKFEDKGFTTFFYRDAMACITYLLGQRYFEPDMQYEPVMPYDELGARMYNELHTGDHWHDIQATLPVGATYLPIICASDKTHLTNFSGDKKMWPVYLTLGNISSKARASLKKRSSCLVALLPVSPKFAEAGVGKAGRDRRQKELNQTLIRDCFNAIFQGMRAASVHGETMLCPDGNYRLCYPRICAWIADHEENYMLHAVKGNACPACEMPPSNFGARPSTVVALKVPRDATEYLEKLREMQTPGRSRLEVRETLQYFKDAHLHPYESPFWAWDGNLATYNTLARPDVLHTIHLGVMDHLMKWVLLFLKDHGRLQRFNRAWATSPSYPHFRRFNKTFAEVTQWTGNEMRSVSKIVLPCFVAALTPSTGAQKPIFERAILCVQNLVYFQLMVQYPSHTEDTLAYLRRYLDDFHKNKDVFLLYRADAKVKKKATEMEKELRQNAEAELREEHEDWDSLTKVAKKTLLDEFMEDGREDIEQYKEENANFDFVKMHYLSHMEDSIRLFGNLQGLSTETMEHYHTELKQAFQQTNKIQAARQILVRLSRQELFKQAELEAAYVNSLRHPSPSNANLLPHKLRGRVRGTRKDGTQIRNVRELCTQYKLNETDFIRDLENYFQQYTAVRYFTPEEKLLVPMWPVEAFNSLQIPTVPFGESERHRADIVRATGPRPWLKTRSPRRDAVMVWMQDKADTVQYNVFNGTLPAYLDVLFKLKDPRSQTSLRLALVTATKIKKIVVAPTKTSRGRKKNAPAPDQQLDSQDRPGKMATVSTPAPNEQTQLNAYVQGARFFVPISQVMSAAHLVEVSREPREFLVNNTIDLETWNSLLRQ